MLLHNRPATDKVRHCGETVGVHAAVLAVAGALPQQCDLNRPSGDYGMLLWCSHMHGAYMLVYQLGVCLLQGP